MRLYGYHDQFPSIRKAIGDRTLCIFSPFVTSHEVSKYYSSSVLYFKEWEELIGYLKMRFSRRCKIGIFPCASIQLASNWSSSFPSGKGGEGINALSKYNLCLRTRQWKDRSFLKNRSWSLALAYSNPWVASQSLSLLSPRLTFWFFRVFNGYLDKGSKPPQWK